MTDLTKPCRILVRGTNWIGDSVMSLAALRELRRLHPEHQLTLLVKRWVAGLFEGQGLVDKIITFDENESTMRRIRPYRFHHFDCAILFQNAFEAALLAFLSRIPIRAGYDTQWRRSLLTLRATPRTRDLGKHQVFYYLDLLHQTGFSETDYLHFPSFRPDISLKPVASGLEKASKLLHQMNLSGNQLLIGLNPGAYYGSAKRWLTQRYAALADRLIQETGAEILVFGSKGEEAIAEEIKGQMSHRPRILAGATDLPTLMALISKCRVFVTNDSGPMHLAAAIGVPQVAIFGSTDETATGPFSGKARVIHKHVECSPCLLRECPIDLRCFNRIEVDEVFDAARALISSSEPGVNSPE